MGNMPFQPPAGLIGEDTVFAAPGRWRNGSMIRWWQGQWQVKGGWERLSLENLGGVCRAVLGWTNSTDFQTIGFGLHNGLKVWQDSLIHDITPVSGFTPGEIDGTGGAGYSTGAYGIGEYGEPSLVDYFPLTWSLATWGLNLLANPRGQGIFEWDGNPANKAVLIATAPEQVTYMGVAPQRQVFAFGCNEEVSGDFNPLCIRWSDIEDQTDWTSSPDNNAGEWILESGGRIVCARNAGDYWLVWTADGLFFGTFVGDPGQSWKFERVGQGCGSISPGAPVVKGRNASWIAPDGTFWSYGLGGEPQMIASPIRNMFDDRFAQGQNDKIVGSTINGFGELCWFYADSRDGLEVSRSIVVGPDGWSRDLLARSAFCDAGPQANPIGVSPTGWVYWHEKGQSADGAALAGFIESTDFYLDEADGGVMLNGIWPDFKSQVGILQLRIFGREYPQDTERTYGPWSIQPGQKKRSFRLTARIARVRIDFASAPCFARGGKPEFDVQGIGGR